MPKFCSFTDEDDANDHGVVAGGSSEGGLAVDHGVLGGCGDGGVAAHHGVAGGSTPDGVHEGGLTPEAFEGASGATHEVPADESKFSNLVYIMFLMLSDGE